MHDKDKKKKGVLPEDVVYICGEKVPDHWCCYPWDAEGLQSALYIYIYIYIYIIIIIIIVCNENKKKMACCLRISYIFVEKKCCYPWDAEGLYIYSAV